jgi:hypothetical protein
LATAVTIKKTSSRLLTLESLLNSPMTHYSEKGGDVVKWEMCTWSTIIEGPHVITKFEGCETWKEFNGPVNHRNQFKVSFSFLPIPAATFLVVSR